MQFYNDYTDKQKKYFRLGFGLVLIGLILALFSLAASYFADAREKSHDISNATQIAVNGEGKVSAKPDIAMLNVSVVTERATVSDAQKENTASYTKIVEFLKKVGINEKDVKTTNYSIYPQYYYPENRKPQISGYQVRNTLEIKIRDLSKVDDVLGGVVSSGANEVGNVSFTIENPDALRQEARQAAIREAKEKAVELSKDLGVHLKRIVRFDESDNGGTPPPIFYDKAASYGTGAGGPELSQGEQEIKVSVTITYEFWSR